MREQYNPFLRSSDGVDAKILLPKNVKPTHYDVKLEPDLENASFSGTVIIHFDVLQTTAFILLNSVGLDITETEVLEPFGGYHKIPKLRYDEAQQTVMVPLPNAIRVGSKLQLRQTFTGSLKDSKAMAGFMRSVYTGFDGKPKWIASTQGEATGIRQIFPCADEPALKATFSSTLIVDEGLTCLSNMDVASEESNGAGKKTVVFNKTPPMSTYLVVFVVGELNYIESNQFRVPVRVYATPDRDISGGKFALEVGARAMISHEKTFALPYPLPKLDMVAVPGHGGGMENWGCVLYDPTYLVRDENDVSALTNLSSGDVIIHELAHQWFGNIVTAKWWDSIWLNESFADWATYNAITHMFPDWQSWSNFVTSHPSSSMNSYQTALALDSNQRSHPIEVPVSSPEQISQIFDAITYAKGCSVIRMIADYLGVEVFIKGVQFHLRKHAFGNATTDDLWDSLSAISGLDVGKIMAAWTQKVGYPVLSVIEDEETQTMQISQHRFLQSGPSVTEDDALVYPIFLKTKSRRGIDQESHLFGRKGQFRIDPEFYKLNAGQTGLYRVSYPLSRWEKLGSQLSTGLLTPEDRVGLISDFRALVASGGITKARTSDFLSFLSNFRSEVNYFVWRQIIVSFQQLRAAWMFEDVKTQQALSAFQTDLMTPILNTLGEQVWNFKPDDNFNAQDFKAILFSNATDYLPIRKIALWLFNRFAVGDSRYLNPNIRQAVFESGITDAKASPRKAYEAVLAEFRSTKSLTARLDALVSLGAAQSPSLIAQTLELANSSEIQSGTEITRLLTALQKHPSGVEHIWEWLRENWTAVVGGIDGIIGGKIIGSCVEGFSTWEQVKEVEAFFKGKDTKKFDAYLAQALDGIRGKASWVERDREDVSDWLKAHGYYESC